MRRANAEFWKEYRALPANIRERADEQVALLGVNPRHPFLQFKKLSDAAGSNFGPRG
jgi:hypothetical protein